MTEREVKECSKKLQKIDELKELCKYLKSCYPDSNVVYQFAGLLGTSGNSKSIRKSLDSDIRNFLFEKYQKEIRVLSEEVLDEFNVEPNK